MFVQFINVNYRVQLPKNAGGTFVATHKFAYVDPNDKALSYIGNRIAKNDWHRVLEELPENKQWRDYDIASQGGSWQTIHEKQKRLIEAGEWKIHPLPDFTQKKVALIGRGKSALGWQERYPKADFIRVGINLGVNRERNWMKLKPDDLDVWASCDANAFTWACSNFLETYHGPLIGPPSAKDNFTMVGPGTYHGIAATGQSQSLTYSLKSVFTKGCREVVIVGCDLQDERVKHGKDNHFHDIRSVENMGMKVWIDKHSKFEELKKQHKVY